MKVYRHQQPLTVHCWAKASFERRFWPTIPRWPDGLVKGLFKVFLLLAVMLAAYFVPLVASYDTHGMNRGGDTLYS